MPQAVTHVLAAAIIADLYRDYFSKHKRLFTMHHIFLAGLGGLLPDIDVAISMLFELFGQTPPVLLVHGGITHTPLFAFLFLLPAVAMWYQDKKKESLYLYMIGGGILTHLFLDWFLGGGGHYGLMLLFPFSMEGFKFGLFGMLGLSGMPQALDAVVLLAWLWHEEMKHKISDFL